MKTLIAFVAALLVAPLAHAAEDRIQRVISPGGIEAWLVEEHAIPMIAVELMFPGGARVDAEGQEGAAYLTAALIEEGAGDMDSQGFALRKEEISPPVLDSIAGEMNLPWVCAPSPRISKKVSSCCTSH